MAFRPNLSRGDSLSNQELMRLFKCGNAGGMRRSRVNQALVVVSDYTKGLYDDRWVDEVLHYTGMGSEGDQGIDYAQNKTLAQSEQQGVAVFLFEVFKTNHYLFQGQVRLVGAPYQEEQLDKHNVMRKVWMFPLSLVEGSEPAPVDFELKQEVFKRKVKLAQKMTLQELQSKVGQEQGHKEARRVVSRSHARSPYVAELTKRRAAGVCELCQSPAPFKSKKGEPYLEVHHIQWLSKGGLDVPENTVALCPNCHRKMHSLDLAEDKERLMDVTQRS